ncbi:MAG: ankyrin repeat domain-containing protein [Burkholderiales bacterium]|nr:ankyrin repeat domain-containing protein [Burkholderiales bacterium]
MRVCEFLIQEKASVNARSENGSSPLMMAAREGHAGVLRLLLNSGADPNLETDTGRTALQWAQATENAEIAELLKAAGARR